MPTRSLDESGAVLTIEKHPPELDSIILGLAALCYLVAFSLVLVWTLWSVRKHGWCRRSLRRCSYLLFLLLLAVRLAWCAILLRAPDVRLAPNIRPLLGGISLREIAAFAIDVAAFVIHFAVFSMLVQVPNDFKPRLSPLT